jgi:GTPase SAR1 family protein
MSYKKIIILGPPCVGKTTLAYTALKNKIPSFTTHGLRGHQLSSMAKAVINLDMSLFFDAGGLMIGNLNHKYKNNGFGMRTVLLLPPRDVYLERERIEIERSENRNQDGSSYYDQHRDKESGTFDLVIKDVLSPQEILDYIIEKTGFKNVI